jgi:hypothetical protein
MIEPVAVVAIIKDEAPFLDEWLLYHRMLGAAHFYLYDDDPALPLAAQTRAHAAYVTVTPWADRHAALPGRNKQTKAYTHAVAHVREPWIAIIDCDEFLVLRAHASLPAFVAAFPGASAIRLNWHLFGHSGWFHDPPLVTAMLTRRRRGANRMTKAITRRSAIAQIDSAHHCVLRRGERTVDANGRAFDEALYPGRTDVAHVNHYMCRSFRSWMARAQRGEAAFERPVDDPAHRWRFSEHGLLRKFVELTRDLNELEDDYMLRFREALEPAVAAVRTNAAVTAPVIAIVPAESLAARVARAEVIVRRWLRR